MKLDPSTINWEKIYSYSSEMVRLDEVLKLKQAHLTTLNCTNAGWTIAAANEISENKRMVNNMRCFIQQQGRQVFPPKALKLPHSDHQALKNFSAKTINLDGKVKDNTQLWYLIAASTDKRITEDFYRHLLEQMIDWSQNIWESDPQKNIEMIISKVTFCVD